MRKRNFTSFEVLAEPVRKAELQIFASQDRAEVQEQNFTYLAVKAERKSGTSHLLKSWQNKCGKRNFRSLPVKTERKCRRRTSHIWQLRQSESADVELQVFGSQGRAEMRKRNIRSLAVKAEQKCGSGISDL